MSDNTYGDILANMRAFFKTGATLPIEWRREQLAALKRCIFENQVRPPHTLTPCTPFHTLFLFLTHPTTDLDDRMR